MRNALLAGLLAMMGLGVNAQELIKNGNFETEVNTKVNNANKATAGEWFILNNESSESTTIAWEKSSKAKQPNTIKIDNSKAEKNTAWYRVFAGQRITEGLEKSIYELTFYAKTKTPDTPVSVYIKQTNEEKNADGKHNTTFFMRRDYNEETQPNSSGAQHSFKIPYANKWTKVTVYYNMGKTVNKYSSKKSSPDLEVSDTEDNAAILNDCYIAILSQNKGSVVEISDVSLKKK